MRKPVALGAAIAGVAAAYPGSAAVQAATCNDQAAVRSARMPSLADLELAPSTTREEVRAAWGEPTPGGPGGEMDTYWLENGATSQQLWLSFSSEAPHALSRAILLDRNNPVAPRTKTLLNRIEATRTRRRDQLDLARPLTAADVYAVWGPPDSVAGSGIQYWGYTMADGTVATLVFDGGRVLGSGKARD